MDTISRRLTIWLPCLLSVACDGGLAVLESDCRKLTSYGVAARYPDDLFEPEEADGRDVVAAAHRVRTKILLLLPRSR